MSTLSPGADDLRRRAATLRATARRLDHAELHDLGRRAGPDTWLGPTATAFADDLAGAVRALHAAHDDLVRAAVRLEATADDWERAARAALVTPTGSTMVAAPR